MLLNRILTAVVGIPILLYLVFAGGAPFAFTILLFSVIGIFEYSRLIEAKGLRFCPVVYIFPVGYIAALSLGRKELALQVVIALVLYVLARQLLRFPEYNMMSVGVSLTAALYPTLLLGNVYLLRSEAGLGLTLVTMLAIMAYDTLAYFVGISLGRRRPWHNISPKKSIEGALGGFIGSIGLALAATRYIDLTLMQALIIGIGVGGLGQVGDLAESAIKRYAGVKDSGNLLPGHGGVLDRFDSLMYAGSFVYWLYLATILR